MTMSQLIESMVGKVCAVKGTHVDGTMFKKIDIESVAEELEQMGMHRYGYERMISGLTGEYIDTLVFFGPTFYQRLQKFVADAEYSVQRALTDAITFQPLEGQGSSGGLKVGKLCRKAVYEIIKIIFVKTLLVCSITGNTIKFRETLCVQILN
jgi:DNA-directed RNA polymerase beta subunit